MKKLLVLFMLSSSLVFAADSGITPIENPTWICSQKGGTVVLNVEQERLWQGELPSDTEGLELDVQTFEKARCPNCYSVVAKLSFMGESADFYYNFIGDFSDFSKARVTISAKDETGEILEIATLPCEKVN